MLLPESKTDWVTFTEGILHRKLRFLCIWAVETCFIEENQNYSKNVNVKWTSKGVIDNNWKRFITPTNSTPGKMYGLVKTHKVTKPVRVITSSCNTAIESLSIYMEHILFELSESMPSRIKDSNICLI